MTSQGSWRQVFLLGALALGAVGCASTENGPTVGSPTSYGGVTRAVAETSLDATRYTTVESMLQGQIAGLRVIRYTNGRVGFRIRGPASLYAGNDALVVVDGVPIAEGRENVLSTLNPADVARIDVFKDAGTTSFFGGSGTNGVIVITTRRAY